MRSMARTKHKLLPTFGSLCFVPTVQCILKQPGKTNYTLPNTGLNPHRLTPAHMMHKFSGTWFVLAFLKISCKQKKEREKIMVVIIDVGMYSRQYGHVSMGTHKLMLNGRRIGVL